MGVTALLGLLVAAGTVQDQVVIPGVVFSATAGIVYCTTGERRLVALKLATGKPLWNSDQKGWPLAVMGDDLVVAVSLDDPHAFRLKVFGASDGKFRMMSRTLVIPVWAKPVFNYDQLPGYEFGIRVEPISDAKLGVYWSARKWDAGGIALNPRLAQGRNAEEGGGFEFHVGSGYLTKIDPPLKRIGYGLSGRRPDPANPASTMLSEMLSVGTRTLYLSESSTGPNDPVRPIRLVCMPQNSTTPAWTFSLGNRNVPKLRM